MTEVDSSSGFPSDTQCDFDLKFDDLEGDENLMSSAGDLFTSDHASSPAVLQDFGDHTSDKDRITHDRKRKMDEEGFVTPTTPDIPKSSLQYEAREGESGLGDNENPADGFLLTQQEQQRKKHKLRKPQHHATDPSSTNTSMSQMPDKAFQSAADMFEEVAQRTKMLIIQMAQNFRESEEYESVCLANVESLLMEAKDLESSLRHQKDLLQQRIYMIGRRLGSEDQ